MSGDFVYLGDMPDIECDFGRDVSTASVRSFEALKPDGTTTSWAAAANGATGIKYAVPDTSTLNKAGSWVIQPKLTIGGKTYSGTPFTLEVRRPFT